MSDTTTESLRSLLRRVDGTAEAIKGAAGAMLRHYDRSTPVAVTEWRNCLQTSRPDQLLPLLYVANEVMQNSKRNRGHKFLDAFSPVLGQALRHICSTDPSITEKVRRTAKIWGDRAVFSPRFVGELLQGLEPYRQGGGRPPPPPSSRPSASPKQQQKDDDDEGARFSPDPPSPAAEEDEQAAEGGSTGADKQQKQKASSSQQPTPDDEEEEEDIMNILEQSNNKNNEDDEDDEMDDDDVFGRSSEGPKLDISINTDILGDAATAAAGHRRQSGSAAAAQKRRRSSGSHYDATSQHQQKRRRSVMSANHLLDLISSQLAGQLQQTYDSAVSSIDSINAAMKRTPTEALENLVGDELQLHARTNARHKKQAVAARGSLYGVAQERHAIEQDCIRYLPWLQKALYQDAEDLQFCDQLEQKLLAFKQIHPQIVQAHDVVKAEEERQRQRELAEERRRREAEESEKFRKAALAKETEAKPGMVWNPTTREYQTLNTDEDWRD